MPSVPQPGSPFKSPQAMAPTPLKATTCARNPQPEACNPQIPEPQLQPTAAGGYLGRSNRGVARGSCRVWGCCFSWSLCMFVGFGAVPGFGSVWCFGFGRAVWRAGLGSIGPSSPETIHSQASSFPLSLGRSPNSRSPSMDEGFQGLWNQSPNLNPKPGTQNPKPEAPKPRLSALPSWFWRGVILVLCMLWATNFAVIKDRGWDVPPPRVLTVLNRD